MIISINQVDTNNQGSILKECYSRKE